MSNKQLKTIFNKLNKEYFDNSIEATIAWKDFTSKTGEQGDRWGEYFYHFKHINISNLLDVRLLKNVPERFKPPAYFLEYIVFHEMLHQYMPFKRDKLGRVVWHHAEFRAFEKTYVNYQKAFEWSHYRPTAATWQKNCIAYGRPGYFKSLSKLNFNVKQKYSYLTVFENGKATTKAIEIIGLMRYKKQLLFLDSQTNELFNIQLKNKEIITLPDSTVSRLLGIEKTDNADNKSAN